MQVAIAAPFTLRSTMPTKIQSKTILVHPANTVIINPNNGFSAVEKNVWKTLILMFYLGLVQTVYQNLLAMYLRAL